MVGPARDRQLLKRRIDAFLWRDQSMPVKRLRRLLDERFASIGRVAIIGGLVRDIARRGRASFRSDVDLVIDAPKAEVEELATHLAATANRFGGFAYHHPHWKVDFWALENTWAVVNGHVEASRLEDLVHSTFFDCDAILYDIQTRKVVAAEAYFERLARNEIDINLRANPSEDGNLLRAIRRVFSWGVEPGPQLREFIFQNLDDDTFQRIHRTEIGLYPIAITTHFGSAGALRSCLLDPQKRSEFETSIASQMRLPGV